MSGQPSVSYVLRRLPVKNKAEILVDDQELNDIIKSIKKYHNLHKTQYDDIAKEFWQGDARKTAKLLFDFLKKHVIYHVEPESDQTIKSPGRIIQDGHGDCKHYASFIVGVVDALERAGLPIHAYYRFVADLPSRDVHHVFAVVQDRAGDSWVDPVLQTFDERPKFYNTKDISFSKGIGRLTYLSGTAAQMGDYEIGAGGRGRAKVKAALKKVQHGMQVNLQNAAKGANKVVKKVTHATVKVAAAPARNAFLALVDINAFNLAQRVSDALRGPKGNALRAKWKQLGGNPDRLASAANNGLKFKAKMHKNKSVKGFDCCIGMGATYHSDMITTHPDRWAHDYWSRRPRRRQYRGTAVGNDAYIGVEPVSTASLVALASGILAVLAEFIGRNNQEQMAMAQQAQDGGMAIVEQAAAAQAEQGVMQAAVMNEGITPSGGADASLSVRTGVDEYGQPSVIVDDVRHPALQNAGGQDGGAGADSAAPQKGFLDKAQEMLTDTWSNHKGLIIGVTAVWVLTRNKKLMKKVGF